MRRPPYSRRVMRGIYLIWQKMGFNLENGHIPYWWSRKDIKDAAQALRWLGNFFDWVEWREAEKGKAKDALEENPEATANEDLLLLTPGDMMTGETD